MTTTSTRRRKSDAGEDVVAWIEKHCVHTKGEWAGQPLKLEAWQQGLIQDIFGKRRRDGLRQYRTCLLGLPRKSGKTTLGAAMALRLLFRDGEPGAEIYSVAADREQAALCFEIGRSMVEANPAMSRIAKPYRRAIVVPRTGSVWKVLSADAPTKHGLNPHGVIFDELHAQPSRELWDVMTSGQGARRQPLVVAITTAGSDRESICYQLYEYGQQVAERVIEDPSFYFAWWGASEGDDWTDERVWEKANPNLDVSVRREFLRAEAKQAKHLPEKQNMFRRLYCNQWVQQVNRWLDLGLWDENAGMFNREALRGRECYAGLDLSATSDLTALSVIFPGAESDTDGPVHPVFAEFWLPGENVEMLVRTTKVPFDQWIKDGLIHATRGNAVDYDAVVARVVELAETYDLRAVGYDPWNAFDLVRRLQDEGINMVPMRQGFATLSPACKEFERLLLAKRLRHSGNAVLRWMADVVEVKQDGEGNIKPEKPSRAKTSKRIDGIVALVMAIGQMTSSGIGHSAYEDRDLEFA